MKKFRKIVLALVALGVLAWLAFGFFGIQALFVENEVKEEIPESISNLIAPSSGQSGGSDSSNQLLGKGSFTQGDSTYTISGNAFLSRVDGKLNLTFFDFEVTNGPALYVYAVKTHSTDNKTVKETIANGGFINLGPLKGNIGTQNYTLESEFDLSEYQVISVWCKRFSRNFGSANLVVAQQP